MTEGAASQDRVFRRIAKGFSLDVHGRLRIGVVIAGVVLTLSACGENDDEMSAPSADQVIQTFNDMTDREGETVLTAVPGRGDAQLPPVTPTQGLEVSIYCLNEGSVSAVVDQETLIERQSCDDSSVVTSLPASGGEMQVSVEADTGTYWVAVLVDRDGASAATP